jgi:hypothetical protein
VEGGREAHRRAPTAIWSEPAAGELELLDLGYAPPFSGVYDPLLIAARRTANRAAAAAGR